MSGDDDAPGDVIVATMDQSNNERAAAMQTSSPVNVNVNAAAPAPEDRTGRRRPSMAESHESEPTTKKMKRGKYISRAWYVPAASPIINTYLSTWGGYAYWPGTLLMHTRPYSISCQRRKIKVSFYRNFCRPVLVFDMPTKSYSAKEVILARSAKQRIEFVSQPRGASRSRQATREPKPRPPSTVPQPPQMLSRSELQIHLLRHEAQY